MELVNQHAVITEHYMKSGNFPKQKHSRCKAAYIHLSNTLYGKIKCICNFLMLLQPALAHTHKHD